MVSKENQSEESEAAPKIVRESSGGSPLKIKKRTESMNLDPQHALKTNAVFASVNLKRIDEKID